MYKKQVIVLLQARVNSSRLPAKILLPIKNSLPLVVLAAKRAQNTGLPLMVVTSDEPSDDPLTSILEVNNVKYFRGSLENVLFRFVNALKNYASSTIVVRLTADNVFVDGHFIEEVLLDFEGKSLEYICTTGQGSGLPYGVSLEITKLQHLRDALNHTSDPFDLEHVTPYIRRKFGNIIFDAYQDIAMENYRCTIDSFDDYLAVQRVFKNIADPIDISTPNLIDQLKQNDRRTCSRRALTDLVLGTAQLGMDYGIANKDGQPNSKVSEEILKVAVSNGVQYIDTARAYGVSEQAVSSLFESNWKGRFQVITKLQPFDQKTVIQNDEQLFSSLTYQSIFESLFCLKTNYIDVVLYHRLEDMFRGNKASWKCLCKLKQRNIIGTLGVSVQSPDELLSIIDNEEIGFIQLPFNILDNRWNNIVDKIIEEKNKRTLTIHVRSVFLQGLLLTQEPSSWKKAHINESEFILSWLDECCDICERENIMDLCISYVRAHKWIDGLVVGMESIEQLNQNIELFNRSPLTIQQVEHIKTICPNINLETLNPAMWEK